jgi:hypothetical protein
VQGLRRHRKPQRPARGEFHGVVDEVFDHGAQPHRVPRHLLGEIARDRDIGLQGGGGGAGRQCSADGFGKPARGERLLPQDEARGLRAHRVADHGGERGEMLGRAFDAVRPAPLALGDVRGREQFSQREDAGQRRADVMRQRGERRFGRVVLG